MQKLELTIRAKVGLHARTAAVLVQTAMAFKCDVTIRNITDQRGPTSAKSLVSVLSLSVKKDHVIELIVDGEDEDEAIAALREQAESNFGEDE